MMKQEELAVIKDISTVEFRELRKALNSRRKKKQVLIAGSRRTTP